MKYVGVPKWRWLLFPICLASVIPFGLLTLLTAGMVRGMSIWSDWFDWCVYHFEKQR